VEAIGPPREGLTGPPRRVGDRVVALTRFGGYATALNVDARHVVPVTPGWTAAEAAAFPVQAITAWYGLVHLGRVTASDTVLVHSGAGGVGLNARAMLSAIGATVILTVGRADKRDFLVRTFGVAPEHIVVRDVRRFGAQLEAALAAVGRPAFAVVFDAIAGPFFRPAFDRLAPEGRHVLYGAADFMTRRARPDYLRLAVKYLVRPRLDPLAMIASNRSVMGFNLIWLWDQAERLPAACQASAALLSCPPHVGARFPFDDLPAALRFLQSGESVGKVVVELGRHA
jgi:alcohol dehydrogenase